MIDDVIDIYLDPGFNDFYKFCKGNDIPVVIVSSGMEPNIRAVLSKFIGEEEAATIDIVSNHVKSLPNGKWEIQYRHPTRYVCTFSPVPGLKADVLDMSAARHADVLFVKLKQDNENDLHEYCKREGIPHVLFSDFLHALNVVKAIVTGERTKEDVLKEGTAMAV
ncbi:hypothetical protein A7U60_g800 [Sanghuangporus baumii]|uniref:Uncharacterized protein n=1 Tax=Sanghuangporus baumii TaxID=108892 RepID=A0A9Q5I5K9_SANBA|nr:hypothetical protein A7U60_g800 [Sanghuangporus baumii]